MSWQKQSKESPSPCTLKYFNVIIVENLSAKLMEKFGNTESITSNLEKLAHARVVRHNIMLLIDLNF